MERTEMKTIFLICAPEPLTFGFMRPEIKNEIIENGLPPLDWQRIKCLQIGDTPVSAAIIKAFDKHCQKEFKKKYGDHGHLELNYLGADDTLLNPEKFPDCEGMGDHLRHLANLIGPAENCLAVADARAIKIMLGLDSRSRKQIKPLSVYKIKISAQNRVDVSTLAA